MRKKETNILELSYILFDLFYTYFYLKMSLQWNTNNIYTLYKGSHKLGVMRSAPVSHTDLFPRPWLSVARNNNQNILYTQLIIKLVTV